MTRMTRIILILSIVLGACAARKPEVNHSGPVFEDPDRDPYNFYRSDSLTLLRTQQFTEAIDTVRRMRKLHPSDAEPEYLMARVHTGLQQFELAERSLRLALKMNPRYPEALSQMGVLLDLQGNHSLARDFHRRAIALAPEQASYRNNLGFSLYLDKRYQEAISTFSKALELDASARRVHNNLAFAFGRLGNMTRAYSEFRLAGVPAQASNNVGFLYEERGELARAYDYYVTALQEDPELTQARRNLERVCVQLGRPLPDLPEPTPPPKPSSFEPPADPPTPPEPKS